MAEREIDKAALEFACSEAFAYVGRDWSKVTEKGRENVLAQAEVFLAAYRERAGEAAR